tara:strand:- start:651 stop:854 length:204 start_codon:yes stop_codon:yes gene_type:complete
MEYDTRHGGPFDRGGADYYYHRPIDPHYFIGGTSTSDKIIELTPEERGAYIAGYKQAEEYGHQKDWG